jgi:hypothetical protein
VPQEMDSAEEGGVNSRPRRRSCRVRFAMTRDCTTTGGGGGGAGQGAVNLKIQQPHPWKGECMGRVHMAPNGCPYGGARSLGATHSIPQPTSGSKRGLGRGTGRLRISAESSVTHTSHEDGVGSRQNTHWAPDRPSAHSSSAQVNAADGHGEQEEGVREGGGVEGWKETNALLQLQETRDVGAG